MFLQDFLSDVYENDHRLMLDVSLPWPSPSQLKALTAKADGLFIFATTLMNFFCDGSDPPQEALRKVLTTDVGLDALYTQVLSRAQSTLSNAHAVSRFMRVIGTIMVLRDTLSVTALWDLFQLLIGNILHALLRVRSILMIPGDDTQAIRLFHTSLRDFLTSQSRANEFYVNPPTRQLLVAIDCSKTMGEVPAHGIVFEGGQRYAAMNWCFHLYEGFVQGGYSHLDKASQTSLLSALKMCRSQYHRFWVNTILLDSREDIFKNVDSMLSKMKVLQIFFSLTSH
jgi:hypothetical protein